MYASNTYASVTYGGTLAGVYVFNANTDIISTTSNAADVVMTFYAQVETVQVVDLLASVEQGVNIVPQAEQVQVIDKQPTVDLETPYDVVTVADKLATASVGTDTQVQNDSVAVIDKQATADIGIEFISPTETVNITENAHAVTIGENIQPTYGIISVIEQTASAETGTDVAADKSQIGVSQESATARIGELVESQVSPIQISDIYPEFIGQNKLWERHYNNPQADWGKQYTINSDSWNRNYGNY